MLIKVIAPGKKLTMPCIQTSGSSKVKFGIAEFRHGVRKSPCIQTLGTSKVKFGIAEFRHGVRKFYLISRISEKDAGSSFVTDYLVNNFFLFVR